MRNIWARKAISKNKSAKSFAMRYNEEAKALLSLLQEKGLTFSAAESCTGGLIGKWMTDIPGSSACFKGSAVTYWNSAKETVLGVSPETLLAHTAVSAETAKEMAEGARRLYETNISVSTTGYAGPGKGERGEPAGWVYIAVSGKSATEVHLEQFSGTRQEVREAAARKAFLYAANFIRKQEL